MKKLRYRLLTSVNDKWVKLSNIFVLLKETPCIKLDLLKTPCRTHYIETFYNFVNPPN